MTKYRTNLPQLHNKLFVTDGGLETTLLFHDGVDLPEFAAFTLLKERAGLEMLHRYFGNYALLARKHQVGLMLDSATWRASHDWGKKLGYADAQLKEANQQAIAMLVRIRDAFESATSPMVISGTLGPRGDGYVPGATMTAPQAATYHLAQMKAFAESDADMASALTINCIDEAIGIAYAAQSVKLPVAISFVLDSNGRLPGGQSLQEAIEMTDEATDRSPAYYMINCVHPTPMLLALKGKGAWLDRVRGLRANASAKTHAELDGCDTVDDGNPLELAQQYLEIRKLLRHLNVAGGCCGTDERHIEAICRVLKS